MIDTVCFAATGDFSFIWRHNLNDIVKIKIIFNLRESLDPVTCGSEQGYYQFVNS